MLITVIPPLQIVRLRTTCTGIFLLLESNYFYQTVITNCTFLMNFTSNIALNASKLILVSDSLLLINRSLFISNTGHVIVCSRGNVIVSKTIFVNNSANESSLVYSRPYSFGNIKIEKSEFRGTVAIVRRRGAISLSGHSLIKECIFDNNHAVEGGALSFNGVIIEVIDSTFTNNVAVQRGGAIHTGSFSSFITSFINSSAEWSGGALYVEGFEYNNDNIASVTV